VVVELDGVLLTVTVTQDGVTSTVMDGVDVADSAPILAQARSSGLLGLRTWSGGTDFTIGSLVIFGLD
jgi:hypothetical protein